MRNVVAQVQVDLPQDIQPPIVQQIKVDGGPIAYYDVSAAGMTPQELSWFIDNTITKKLLTVPGVAQVQRCGGVDRADPRGARPGAHAGARHHRFAGQRSAARSSTSTCPAARRSSATASS